MTTPQVRSLAEEAAALVADLPDSFRDLTASELEALIALGQEIFAVTSESQDIIRSLGAAAHVREAEDRASGRTPELRYATEDELTMLQEAARRALDAEEAGVTLSRWEAESGWSLREDHD